MENTSIEDIKARLDIISLAEGYGFDFKQPSGFRYRAVTNLIRDEKTSSLDFFTDSQKYFDRGSGTGGDAIDLIKVMEGITQSEAIRRARELSGSDIYHVEKRTPLKREPKKKEIDLNKLSRSVQAELSASATFAPKIIPIDITDANGYVRERREELHIHSEFEKLFEARKIEPIHFEKMNYLFKNIIGYSSFWKSPSIVIRDRNNKAVDLVAYRPKDKETGEEIKGMKYFYRNQNNRGDDFVYPFENLVDRIAKKEKYIVVGEGLKNAVNALIYSVPFISIESTGNTTNIDKRLIEAINAFLEKGYGLATAFDGDQAGEEAYRKFLSLTGLKAENIFSFDSGIDFVEYVRGSKK